MGRRRRRRSKPAAQVAGSPSALIRIASIVGAVAVALGAGVWLLNDQAPTPTPPPQPLPVPPAAWPQASLPRPVLEAKAEPATQPASAAAPPPSLRTPPSPSDELGTVLFALEPGAAPSDARKAATILARCEGANTAVQFALSLRDPGSPAREQFDKIPGFDVERWIKDAQDTQKRCQPFDTATLARRGELLKRAYEGGAPGVAFDYLLWLNANPNQAVAPDMLGKLQREVRHDAEEGDFETLLLYNHAFVSTLGATAVQRRAYKEALFRIQTEMSGPEAAKASRDSMEDVEKMLGQQGLGPPALSTDEQREANALAERVVAAWRKRRSEGG